MSLHLRGALSKGQAASTHRTEGRVASSAPSFSPPLLYLLWWAMSREDDEEEDVDNGQFIIDEVVKRSNGRYAVLFT